MQDDVKLALVGLVFCANLERSAVDEDVVGLERFPRSVLRCRCRLRVVEVTPLGAVAREDDRASVNDYQVEDTDVVNIDEQVCAFGDRDALAGNWRGAGTPGRAG